jgi:glycerol-3-phosphate acyltransferase PlsY
LLELVLKILLCYLLGSVLGSLIVGRLRGGVDIRKLGSGNAGGTNALRTQGVFFAFGVMVIDIGKGWVAARVLPNMHIPGVTEGLIERQWLAVACAAAVVAGHVYPIWYGFRGGKGAATLVGVLAGLHPQALGPVLACWILVLVITGYVGLATVLATAFFPFYLALFDHASALPLMSFAIAMALFVLFTHRANISRMRAGTENRAHRVWLLRPR